MSRDPFSEFERTGWERAALHYDECWTDTRLFVELPGGRIGRNNLQGLAFVF
jgi:hypothetical protein